MTNIARLMHDGYPAAGLPPTPDAVKDERIQAILATDAQAPRFDSAPSKRRRPWWLVVLVLLIAAALITVSMITGERHTSIPVLSPEPSTPASTVPATQPSVTALLLDLAARQTDKQAAPGQWLESQYLVTDFDSLSLDNPDEGWSESADLRFYIAGGDQGLWCTWPKSFEAVVDRDSYCVSDTVDRRARPLDDQIPRDPDGFKEYLDQMTSDPNAPSASLSQPEREFQELQSILWADNRLAPADLRAAVFRYLAERTDVIITDDSVDPRDGTGIGIGLSDQPEAVNLIVDPDTGELLGYYHDERYGSGRSITLVTETVIDTLPPDFITLACQNVGTDRGNYCPES